MSMKLMPGDLKNYKDAEKPATDVTPAKAGVQKSLNSLESRFRGNDDPKKKRTFSANC
jgi:hypothetical protein